MKEPRQEQIKEFWEWCGIDIEKFVDGVPLERIGEGRYLAHPIDLNNLFKYAMPKVTDWEIGKHFPGGYYVLVYLNTKYNKGYAVNKDPALALFWAIWSVIK